jgi:hypothetical protein
VTLISFRDRATGAALQSIARDLGLPNNTVVLTRYGYEVPQSVADAFQDMGGVHLSSLFQTSGATTCDTGNSCVGPPGPPGPPGFGISVKGTIAGTDTPFPPSPEIGDLWIIGDPVPAVAPPNASDCGGGGGGGGSGGPQPTTVALTASPNPSALNQTVTFTATVTAGGFPVTSGLVQFKSNGVNLGTGSVPVNLLGIASFSTNLLTGASQSITASFLANALFGASTSPPISQIVISPPATATALAASETAIDVGQPVTYTATVTRVDTGAPVTSGSISFKRGANSMASGILVDGSGTATFTTTSIPVGSWDITAVYDGGLALQASTSPPQHIDVTLVGGPAATTSAVVSDDATSIPGQLVTFTASVVRSADGVAVTSGTVAFRDGATVLIAGVAVNPATGTATYSTSALSEGTHPITVAYTGGAIYQNSISPVSNQIVAPGTGGAPISQTLSVSKPNVLLHDVVSIRSTVRSGSATPSTGSVEFREGATVLGQGSVHQFYGEWELTLMDLPLGVHNITAYYTGGPSYEDDVSSPIVLTVVAAETDPGVDWATAFASKNLALITAWFEFNTGVFAQGFSYDDLWNPAGAGAYDEVIMTSAWLTANEGPNVVDDGGGHWTVTGLISTKVTLKLSHITLNHCFIWRIDYANQWGPGVGTVNPTTSSPDNVPNTDITLNYCTLATDGTSSESTYGDAVNFSPDHATANDFTMNYCETTQWRAGFLMLFGATANYCYVHDLNMFGADPHNTSGSIRGRQCRINRCLYADGSSSDVSLYADTNPYTEFWVNENVLWVLPSHASQEVNFPNRSTGWSPLLPGYVREFTDNLLQRGLAGDNMYWSKVSGNKLLESGAPLFGGAQTVQVPGQPTTLAGMSTGILFGATQTMQTYYFQSSPSSVQLMWEFLGRANHTHDPDIALTDESGLIWAPVPGCETPVEIASNNTAVYGYSGSVWSAVSSSGVQSPHRLTIDPYASLTSVGYQAMNVIEITGLSTLTLAQPAVQSAVGHDLPFGAIIDTMTSGQLSFNTTPGNLVMLFVGWTHEIDGMLTPPDGWFVLGNNFDKRVSQAVLWRKDFVGRKVTIPDMGPGASGAVTVLIEVVMP